MRQEPAAAFSFSSSSPSSGSGTPGPGQAVALLRAPRAPRPPPDALLGKPGPPPRKQSPFSRPQRLPPSPLLGPHLEPVGFLTEPLDSPVPQTLPRGRTARAPSRPGAFPGHQEGRCGLDTQAGGDLFGLDNAICNLGSDASFVEGDDSHIVTSKLVSRLCWVVCLQTTRGSAFPLFSGSVEETEAQGG